MSDLRVNIIKYPTEEDWLIVKNNALVTMGKHSEKLPDEAWKIKILKSEHSPIRSLQYIWEWENLPYYIAMHFRTHNIGILHFISTQRNDRQEQYDRRKAPQDSPVTHKCVANAQAIINISKVRMCHKSTKETRDAWILFLEELFKYSYELAQLCAANCIYRNGICPEFESCGYNKTAIYKKQQEAYLNLLQGEIMT